MAIDHSASAFPKTQRKRKKNHSRRRKTLSIRKMVIALDKAARLAVLERDGWKCVRCGSTGNIQWSHVHSRRHYCLRWDEDNSKALCAACHCWWTYNPGLAYEWFRKNFSERWERITAVLIANPKVNVKALYESRLGGGVTQLT